MAEYYCLDGKIGNVKSVEFDDSIGVNDDSDDCNGYFSLRDNCFEFTVNCNDICDDICNNKPVVKELNVGDVITIDEGSYDELDEKYKSMLYVMNEAEFVKLFNNLHQIPGTLSCVFLGEYGLKGWTIEFDEFVKGSIVWCMECPCEVTENEVWI